jgi:hypothetical protein
MNWVVTLRADLAQAHGESGWNRSYGPAHGGRADLHEFSGDAGLSTPKVAGSHTGAVASRLGHRRDARGQLGHGLGHGPVGAALSAWPTVAPVGSYELLMMVIRGSQEAPGGITGSADNPDPLGEQAAELFADQQPADRVPSICAIRAQLYVGRPRVQRLRDHLAAGTARRADNPAA